MDNILRSLNGVAFMGKCKNTLLVSTECETLEKRGFNLTFQFSYLPLLIDSLLEIELHLH